jgi:tRNA (Thr-GGU) A37 N-methylase
MTMIMTGGEVNGGFVLSGHDQSGALQRWSTTNAGPLGLHSVTVREIDGTRVKIGPIEVFDSTPVVDIKSASTRADG